MNKTPTLSAGIGLRAPHLAALSHDRPEIGFLEVHAENYFGGGAARRTLLRLREDYPISLHGVGLSLGGADALDPQHLAEWASLVREVSPILISEHLAWSGLDGAHTPDLLPVPLTEEALRVVSDHVAMFQDTVGQRVLVENPSNYIAFSTADYDEPSFLAALCAKTGCGLLLDVNNIAVSEQNLGLDADAYLAALPANGLVGEIHLAGYTVRPLESGGEVWLDTHSNPVYPAVWELYDKAIRRFGATPTLVEWDADIPPLAVLLGEAAKADAAAREVLHARAA